MRIVAFGTHLSPLHTDFWGTIGVHRQPGAMNTFESSPIALSKAAGPSCGGRKQGSAMRHPPVRSVRIFAAVDRLREQPDSVEDHVDYRCGIRARENRFTITATIADHEEPNRPPLSSPLSLSVLSVTRERRRN